MTNLEVKLGGHTVSKEFIDGKSDIYTPEVISASYARLSRDPRPIWELKRDAMKYVDYAKKSNENIIFGLGHASVAEHASFNIEIYGMSRWMVEFVQKYRLASFTEKSQRYQEMEPTDFMIPKEIEIIPEAKVIFEDLLKTQISAYQFLFPNLKENILKQNKSIIEEMKNDIKQKDNVKGFKITLAGYAKEDARYALPLATTAQFGMTANARTIEHIIPWFRALNLIESKEFAEKLYAVTKEFNSIIKYNEPSGYVNNKNNLKQFMLDNYGSLQKTGNSPLIVKVEKGADDKIMSKLLLDVAGINVPVDYLKNMSNDKKKEFYLKVFEKMNMHDTVPRAFEYANVEVSYDVSASNFAQLKRHRMMSLLDGDYDITKDKEVPPRITEFGFEKELVDVYKKTDEAYEKLVPLVGKDVATYVLTNGHKKHVDLEASMKEIYAISRLREDAHAQWSIRRDMNKIMECIGQQAPLAGMMLAGKHEFDNKYKSVYGN